MNSISTKFYGVFPLLLLLVFSVACRKNKRPIYSVDDIQGQWRRVLSSKPVYDSLQYVSIVNDNGIVDSTYIFGDFTVGTVKWKTIIPEDDSVFIYKDLGSDNSYYSSKITFIKNSNSGIETLFLEINSNGEDNGSWQYWERQ